MEKALAERVGPVEDALQKITDLLTYKGSAMSAMDLTLEALREETSKIEQEIHVWAKQ
jgi:predicted  nucleic acid-binding Zn-ribbon protein